MKQLCVVISILLTGLSVVADPGGTYYGGTTSTTEVAPKVTSEHEVNATSVSNEIKIENSIKWFALTQNFASNALFEKIKSLPGIENFQFIKGKKDDSTESYDKLAKVVKRDSHVTFRLAGPAPLTLMFKVHEEFQQCKKLVQTEEDEEEGPVVTASAFQEHGEAPCRGDSKIEVTGPIAVYGTIPGALSNKMLLQNQVKLVWKVATGYNKKNTEIESSFTTLRTDFPVALQKILSWTQVKPMYSEIFMSNPTRRTLVQVGRVLKSINEETLKGN